MNRMKTAMFLAALHGLVQELAQRGQLPMLRASLTARTRSPMPAHVRSAAWGALSRRPIT
jgi:hypothetical protein